MSFTPYVYDDEEAIMFIASRTGNSEESVSEFVRLRTRYSAVIGVASFRDEAEIAEERRSHADLLPAEEFYEDSNLLLAYVCRLSQLSESSVADMIAEETAYFVEIQIMDSDSYPDFRAWADSRGAKMGDVSGRLTS